MQFIHPEAGAEGTDAGGGTAGIVSDTLDLAVRHLARREPWLARPLVEQVVILLPQSATAHRLLADTKREMGETLAAEGDYLAALRLDPEVPGANLGYGMLLLSAGRLDEAALQLSRAVEIDGSAWSRLFDLGLAFRRAARFADGLLAFQAVREVRPSMAAEALVQMGICLRGLGRTADSVAAFRAAVMERPHLAEGWTHLVDALFALDEPNDATIAVRGWVRAMPDDPVARHLSAAQAKIPPFPEAASAASVRAQYDRLATVRGEALPLGGWHAANLLASMVAGTLGPAPSSLDVLDAGCGTGAAGLLLRPWARTLAGVDISPRMAESAAARACYDRLDAAEALTHLQGQPDALDLLVLVDVLAQTGPVDRWLDASVRALRSDGSVVLSVDVHDGDQPWVLRADGRYAHDVPATVAAVEAAGMAVRALHVASVRRDREVPAQVAFILATRARRGRG
ncbi:MAG: tetratricopeptide repeat protein [Rhodospirillales bacterium]